MEFLSTDLNSRFSTWLLRPYLDLCTGRIGRTRPLHVQNLEECWRSFVEPGSAPFVPQRALSPGFRIQLAREAGAAYDLSDPRQLAERLRSVRWSRLCGALDDWDRLQDEQKSRLAALLHCLGFYGTLLDRISNAGFTARFADPEPLRLAFWRASANFIDNLPTRTADYHAADLSIFEDIAINGRSPAVAFDATVKVFVHIAKTKGDLQHLIDWGKRLEAVTARAVDAADGFAVNLITSRFYRAMGFLPQRIGDRAALTQTMDMAEQHARKATPSCQAEQLLYFENLHAVFESRTKESLWLGDTDEALSRSLKVIEIDPCDSKAWVETGELHYRRRDWQAASQAYLTAAMLGPPASAAGRYMAGICFGKMGQDVLAGYFLKDALEVDSLGISSRHRIDKLSGNVVLDVLKEWNHSPQMDSRRSGSD
jgi:tetratricopeptide (TPR) repeat protein